MQRYLTTTKIGGIFLLVMNTLQKLIGLLKGDFFLDRSNEDIRLLISKNKLKYWEVAEAIGISSFTFTVWLRTPLTDERKERVEKAVNELLMSF